MQLLIRALPERNIMAEWASWRTERKQGGNDYSVAERSLRGPGALPGPEGAEGGGKAPTREEKGTAEGRGSG